MSLGQTHNMTKKLLTLLAASCAAILPAHSQEHSATLLPEVTTTGAALSEEAPIGETQRPEWTSARRFPGTRVYIQKEPWEVGVESWWRIKNHRDGSASNRLLEEVEIGLPYRMQLDLYNDIEGDGDSKFHYQSFNTELRWAPADWGKIWGNPTFYGEYKFADHHWGPDVYEFKLLIGDEFAKRWHWGVNFVWEAETGGDREQEFQIPAGLSYSLIDGKLGIGAELLYDHDTVKGERGKPAHQFNIGPSIQIRPTERMHISISGMFGTNNDSDTFIGFVIVGFDLGRIGGSKHDYSPAAGQGGN